MDRFEKETLMVRIRFLQEDKFLSILSVERRALIPQG